MEYVVKWLAANIPIIDSFFLHPGKMFLMIYK